MHVLPQQPNVIFPPNRSTPRRRRLKSSRYGRKSSSHAGPTLSVFITLCVGWYISSAYIDEGNVYTFSSSYAPDTRFTISSCSYKAHPHPHPLIPHTWWSSHVMKHWIVVVTLWDIWWLYSISFIHHGSLIHKVTPTMVIWDNYLCRYCNSQLKSWYTCVSAFQETFLTAWDTTAGAYRWAYHLWNDKSWCPFWEPETIHVCASAVLVYPVLQYTSLHKHQCGCTLWLACTVSGFFLHPQLNNSLDITCTYS